MTKPVARDGDVTATAGTSPYSGADSGTWTAEPVSYTTRSKVKAGAAAISKAECTFSFSGKSGNSQVSGTEKVELTAGSTKLKTGGGGVLVSGDSKTGTYGNKLEASSSAKLET